jgi:hypothetical protein
MRPANRRGRSLGKAEIADFTGPHKVRHGAYGLLDRRVGIDAVLIIEVDHLDSEPFQARFTSRAHVLGLTTDAAHMRTGGIADNRKFRCQEYLVAAAANRIADQNLVVAVPVNIGCIQEVDAQFECAVNRGDGFRVVAAAIEFRHSHTAQTES